MKFTKKNKDTGSVDRLWNNLCPDIRLSRITLPLEIQQALNEFFQELSL